jgi:hypothetical protein
MLDREMFLLQFMSEIHYRNYYSHRWERLSGRQSSITSVTLKYCMNYTVNFGKYVKPNTL